MVDSGTAAIGGGILTELALKYLDDGMDAEAIAKQLEEDKKKILIVALVDTLEYLKKGGRISKAVAFAGTLLNMKPVLSVADGEIAMLGKARGSKMGNNLLVQEIQKAGGVDFAKPVLLWEQGISNVRYTTIGSVIGTHAGPGAIAAAFFVQ